MNEDIFALMEVADSTQKAAQALLEKADQQTLAAQAAIDRLNSLPAAVTSRVTAEAARAVREAAAGTAASLDGKIKRLQLVSAWRPLIFAVLFMALSGVLLHAYERKTLKDLRVLNEEIRERQKEVARTPKVLSYNHNGEKYYGVEVSEHSRPLQMTDGTWLINFK